MNLDGSKRSKDLRGREMSSSEEEPGWHYCCGDGPRAHVAAMVWTDDGHSVDGSETKSMQGSIHLEVAAEGGLT